MLLFNRIILFSVIIYHHAFSFQFKDAENEYVTFGNQTGETQSLSMDENNPINTTVVLVTEATSEITLDFMDGDEKLFQPYITKIGTDYLIIVGKQIDYESLDGTRFLIQVTDTGDNSNKLLNLQINNLDDEQPSITTSICSMKENTTIDINNTNCSYTVTDEDGFLSSMNFTIIPNTGVSKVERNENEIFAFQYKDQPQNSVYSADVYLVLQENIVLDYEITALYIFQLQATDGGNNPTYPSPSIQIVVQVEDIPDTPPVWTSFLYTTAFDEESEQFFSVSARDGDLGINNPIKYKIENGNEFVEIDETSGQIHVSPIDRDVDDRNTVTFTITAYEVPEETSQNSLNVTFIINDIDDNWPIITIENSNVSSINLTIDENTSGSIDKVIMIDDIDLGNNALYSVTLEDSGNGNFTSAFQIIPNRGYQSANFALTIINSTKLDYEIPTWRIISFEIVATGDLDNTKESRLPVQIVLNDLNDESPIFEKEEYSVDIPENTTKDESIIIVTATDRDEGDIVSYSLLGTTANTILSIDEFNGNIIAKVDNAFDYERQTEVYVQIQAMDEANHRASTQLKIIVTDVNDENPTMSVSSSTTIEENQRNGTVLSITITATDEDTTADLEFLINWNESYATKNSVRLNSVNFLKAQFIIVETISDPNNNKNAAARLLVNEIDTDNTPDYELFDTLFLNLGVWDKNTEMGSGTNNAMILINIENVNDNPPVFTEAARSANRTVTENSNAGTFVGAVIATDEDNMDALIYFIEATDDDTPDWIEIDSAGTLTVKPDVDLDCDDPQRTYLYYTINAFDGLFNSTLNISIYIIDQNDNYPIMFMATQSIMENTANGTIIYTFNATDKDRDAPYNVVAYEMGDSSSTDITNRFRVVNDNLAVILINSATLDRDHGLSEFTLKIVYKDNPENLGATQNKDDVEFKIILLDENDEIPTIITETISSREDLLKGEEIEQQIEAVDYDEPGTNASKIDFFILGIERYTSDNYDTQINVSQDLFDIITDELCESQKASIIVNENLEGYHGYYILNIKTIDFGVPQQQNDENYVKLEIQMFNFKEPMFIFPEADKVYYLATEQTPNYQLYYYNGDIFPNIEASDQQNEKYNIKFELDDSGESVFQIKDGAFGQSTGQLQLTTANFNTSKLYTLKLTANSNLEGTRVLGEASYTAEISFYIQFFDITSDPEFDYTSMTGNFTEESEGLNQEIPIKGAEYPNVDIPDLSIYYLLKTGNDSLFYVNITTGTIRLLHALDFETETSYQLTIQASKSKDNVGSGSEKSQIVVNVIVININDNKPKFLSSFYYGGIMSSYLRGSTITQVTAIDADGDPLEYSINTNTLVPVGNGISDVTNPFAINKNTGEITLNFVVQVNMNGYFTFDVTVVDPNPEHTDTATVKIYIISEDNRINFRFENILSKVQTELTSIENVLDTEFNYKSNVEKIEPDTNNNVDLDNQTIASVYFIDEEINEPIDRTIILDQVTDVIVYSRLRQSFLEYALILMSFEATGNTNEHLEVTLKAWLIGVSVVLGTLCLILLITFLLKTRALNQRINNLSTTKFGSQESGLNRQGITAPTTNKHAVEGSNPVFNNEIDTKEIDYISTASGDSDLIGVEDNPEFDYDDNFEEKHQVPRY